MNENHWWADLYPATATSRRAVTQVFAKASQARSYVELRAFTEQLNGFALGLTTHEWARDVLTVDGTRCMQVSKDEVLGAPSDQTGWARVLDVYGRFGDPLGRYVVAHYPRLHDLRPKGFPKSVMDAIKDLARLNSCTALRKAMLSGFDGKTTPVFESEDHATALIGAIGGRRPPDAGIHEHYATLAYANELSGYAKGLLDNPGKVLSKEPHLTENDVRAMAEVITARAVGLRAQHGDSVLSIEKCADRADALLALVDTEIGDVTREITTIETAAAQARTSGGGRLYHLKERSEWFAEARDSTRNELIDLISLGDAKTEKDALYMFQGRVGKAVKRERTRRTGSQTVDIYRPDGEPIEEPVREVGSMSPLFDRLRTTVMDFRDEIPGGFGRQRDDHDTAEFDVTVGLLDLGIADPREIRDFCKQKWSAYESRAIGSSAKALADNVINIIRWAATRSGLKK